MNEKLREAIATELQVSPEELRPEVQLDSFALWDSMTKLTVMVVLGDALGVPVEPGEIARLKTVADIDALVRAKGG